MGQGISPTGGELSERPLTVGRPAQELDADLEGFDRSTFAQVKRGKLSDNYEVLDELGTGSFGTVNRGRDIFNDSLVAIKSIPKKKIKDPQKVKEEFNVIRQLDHPHICKAYECYEDRKNIYLVMELLTGGTLLETLCRQSKFTEADAGQIMRQILSALLYLHQASFIFRDLKTENVMFSRADVDLGGEPSHRQRRLKEIKLIDFGLCCPFEKGSKMCRAAGTPYSVAPELVTSPVQYDQKCDAWSAGVVLYILLSGKYPFNAKTKDELLHKIRREPCSFTHPVWRKISKDGKTLLAELLRKKADQRTSVGEALMHPWLAKKTANFPDENIMSDVVDSFKHFQNLNMFQKAAVTALAWRATDEETTHLREIFSSLDRDGNGHITVQELRGAIESAGVMIPEDLIELTLQADTDGGGTIEYTEFLAATLDKQKVIKEEVVWEAFRIFDQDGSGTITKKELLKILTGSNGEKIRQAHGNKAVENFLEEYDVSGDAVIDFDEFMEMLMGVKDTYSDIKNNSGAMSRTVSPGTENCMPSARSARRSRSRIGIDTNPTSFPAAKVFAPLVSMCPCTNITRASSEQVGEAIVSPRSARRKPPAAPPPLPSGRRRTSERRDPRGGLVRRRSLSQGGSRSTTKENA
eukprot:TRINITY_DN49697_c0_g1_i1.p1 TRINITY_DN49697_c0_g1~~TRINITY_DN49697_c0_g1_i1.p1  ORF type:complete len:668 (+),score=135.07 TRINITY_DN49697_c0_g1_i1:92-2005(+)